MRAVVIDAGDLHLRDDVSVPSPQSGEVLVRVGAAAVNHVDLMRKPSHFAGGHGGAAIAGLEFAGEVVELGAGVAGLAVGDRVMAMDGNAYAEYAAVDQRLVARVPNGLDWPEAAAVMVSFMTAHDALVTHGGLSAGDTALVQGCTTGVGIAAAQLATWLRAANVVGTSTTAAKLAAMAAYGVDVPVLAESGAVVDAVMQASNGVGAQVILDSVGGPVAADNVAAAAIGGRWVSVGRVAGKTAHIELNEFARKRLTLVGVTFRTRSLAERADVVARFVRGVLPAIAAGALRPKVDRVFDLAEAAAAQEHVRSGRHFGKVVLRVSD